MYVLLSKHAVIHGPLTSFSGWESRSAMPSEAIDKKRLGADEFLGHRASSTPD
jgi:hypothetical protein